MKHTQCVLLMLSLPAFAATSLAAASSTSTGVQDEHCPLPEHIQVLPHGLYRADSGSGRQWLGVAQGDVGGEVEGFVSALFYPEQGAETVGTLRGCRYALQRGDVGLDYGSGSERVSLQNLPAWARRTGPFGIVYYECTGPAASCRFRP